MIGNYTALDGVWVIQPFDQGTGSNFGIKVHPPPIGIAPVISPITLESLSAAQINITEFCVPLNWDKFFLSLTSATKIVAELSKLTCKLV